jgi:hypothetical protein
MSNPFDVPPHDQGSEHEERIRQRAYALWEDAGRPEGDHDRHWHEARRQIAGEDGKKGPTEELPGAEPAEGARAVAEANLQQAEQPKAATGQRGSGKRRRPA